MRVNDPSVESVRLNFLQIMNSIYLIEIHWVWLQCFSFGPTAKSPVDSGPNIFSSHLEINQRINWTLSCSTDHAVVRELSYIDNVLAACRLYSWRLLLRLITSESR